MINAEIIADSTNKFGDRITSFVLTFPRIVLSEFNTHRALTRNSASSRAIPFDKMVEMVKENPFVPIRWMKDHKGMQGDDYYDEYDLQLADSRRTWLEASNDMIRRAKRLNHTNGITKQICNRLLEPFMWHTVICTGTEWENFFALRADDAAEIHIQELAHKMLEGYNESEPKQLKAGQWHIPFGDRFDINRLHKQCSRELGKEVEKAIIFGVKEKTSKVADIKVKIATARCARVSYLNFEGKDDYEADIKLYARLKSMGHMSPFEHCAQAMTEEQRENWVRGNLQEQNNEEVSGWCGNFKGFVQLRKMFDNENRKDERVKQ